ncbi:probable WRKY transcription factor 75 [Durio zibethinus]|uniref:Probable WRKY transcription factor 75 n=1 Tax=Durio zibethinus TaxID=66656 RepID=A0A6P6B8Y3_DURZI|nr:probable WRKY transcription factor 75 [Durio zibethinus]
MENYQMFFPISSSPAAAAEAYHLPTNMAPNNSQVFNNFHGDGSNGFLGLKTAENFVQKPGVKELVQIGKFVGSETEMKSGKKQEKKIRKHRYAFQTRSQVDILDDGYRWRKYGQKAVKSNKFPRSYYRCTHQGCNVKKQVQRLTKDESVVMTTYEGMHSHQIEKATDNFEHILSQMHIYTPF